MARAICYAGWCEKVVRKPGNRFCSQRCAAEWGEEIASGNGDVWCVTCNEWKEPEDCEATRRKYCDCTCVEGETCGCVCHNKHGPDGEG